MRRNEIMRKVPPAKGKAGFTPAAWLCTSRTHGFVTYQTNHMKKSAYVFSIIWLREAGPKAIDIQGMFLTKTRTWYDNESRGPLGRQTYQVQSYKNKPIVTNRLPEIRVNTQGQNITGTSQVQSVGNCRGKKQTNKISLWDDDGNHI